MCASFLPEFIWEFHQYHTIILLNAVTESHAESPGTCKRLWTQARTRLKNQREIIRGFSLEE